MGMLTPRERRFFKNVGAGMFCLSATLVGMGLLWASVLDPSMMVSLIGEAEWGFPVFLFGGIIAIITGFMSAVAALQPHPGESAEDQLRRLEQEQTHAPSRLIGMFITSIVGLCTSTAALLIAAFYFYPLPHGREGIYISLLLSDLQTSASVQLNTLIVAAAGFALGAICALVFGDNADQKKLANTPGDLLDRRTDRLLTEHLMEQDREDQAGMISMSVDEPHLKGALGTPEGSNP